MKSPNKKTTIKPVATKKKIEPVISTKKAGIISLSIDLSSSLNYVNYQAECESKRFSGSKRQNSFSFLKKVGIFNDTNKDILGASLVFVCSPNYLTISPIYLSCLEKGRLTEADAFSITLDVSSLYGLSEAFPGSITVNLVSKDGQIISSLSKNISLLPIDESASADHVDEILASFVTPNDDAVKELVNKASSILLSKYKSSSFAAYQFHDPNKVLEELDALYLALEGEGIRYSEPPSSFEKSFQRVRLPYVVIKEKLGTCIDLSLLLASMIEAVGLRPLLVIVNGHALTGAWLDEDSFVDARIDNGTELLNEASKGYNHLALINAVDASSMSSLNFSQALENGYHALEEAKPFYYALDIASCRHERILPIPTPHKLEDGSISLSFPFNKETKEYETPSVDVSERRYVPLDAKSAKNKFDYWEEKLLDLSLRNRLINLRFPANGIQLLSVDAERSLTFLSSFSKLSLSPVDLSLNAQDKGYGVLSFPLSSYLPLIKEAERKKTILVTSKTGDVDSYLKGLSRRGNTALEESGCNPLFLTLGLIKWFDNDKAAEHGTGAFYAPVFLLPIKMPRRKIGPSYSFEYSFDDLGLNTTILEYFHQVFHLDFSPICGALKKKSDGSIDLRLIYNFIREKIADKKGWTLLEESSTISLFSFAHFVMWSDLRGHRESMLTHPIISSLVSGEAEWKEPTSEKLTAPLLDEKLKPSSLAVPLPADSSQIEAINASSEGESFVLDGPPGTGKSQTIANMIVNFLYHGKSVLFVAEKGVALEVVKRRLDALGLGQFCLEIPSVTTAKSDVLSSLGNLLSTGPLVSPTEFEKAGDEVKVKRDSLNSTLAKLHDKGSLFISPYDAIIGYLELQEYKGVYETKEEYVRLLTSESFKETRTSIKELANEDALVGGYFHNAFLPFLSSDYSLEKRDACFKEVTPLVELLRSLHRDSYNCFRFVKGLKETKAGVACYVNLIEALKQSQDFFYSYLDNDEFLSKNDLMSSYLALCQNEANQINQIKADFTDEVFALDADSLQKQWTSLTNYRLLKKEARYLSVKRKLAKVSKEKHSLKRKAVGGVISLLKQISDNEIKRKNYDLFVLNIFKGINVADASNVKKATERYTLTSLVILSIHVLADGDESLSKRLCDYFRSLASDSSKIFSKDNNALCQDYESLQKANENLKSLYSVDIFSYPETEDYFGVAASKLSDAIGKQGQLGEWCKLLSCLDKTSALVPEELIKFYKVGKIKGEDLEPVYLSSLFYKTLSISLSKDGLSTLSSKDTDKEVLSYASAIKTFSTLMVEETASRLTSLYPHTEETASSTESYQLRKLAKNGGRGVSLRSIFQNYSKLIKTLCPCFLMSPLSVAQYLDPELFSFDAVIFDEASQIPTSEAVGSIARAKSVIIAGDQEQMPPSSFFVSNVGSSAEDEASFASLDEDLESLLDDAIVLGLPRKRLNWHYRSHHESLIAFSNSKFYGNSLLTFPSPNQELASVSFHYIEGLYEKRRGVNRKEAEAVTKEIIRRLLDKEFSKHSIGVVTFNEAQQNLIEDYLDKELAKNPGLDKAPGGEPIFVKNLENVQGDERDVILFSITYAPDKKDGTLSLNFGPLSREKGERRLNVAVSRAREEMMVFSSIKPGEIRAEKAKNEGASYLRSFLDFASRGVSSLANNASNSIVPSNISVADFLADDLRKIGYTVVTNLGASSFKIDLAIVSKDDPDKFVLGIITDGDSYCAPITCRDRNIVQPSILTSLGWRLYRVWSVEYLDHPLEVLKGVVAAINSSNPIKEVKPLISKLPYSFKKKKVSANPNAIPYARYKSKKRKMDFTSPFALPATKEWLNNLINTERPISQNLIEKDFREAFGLSRIADSSRNVLGMALDALHLTIETDAATNFYWPTGFDLDSYRFYRLNSSSFSRDICDISFIELGNAIADILSYQGKMSEPDLYKQVSLLFGFSSLKEKSRAYLARALKSNAGNRLGISLSGDGYVYLLGH